MKQYYIHDGQNQQGPFNLEELLDKGVTINTPIWFEGINDWTAAGQIEEIKSRINTPPPFIGKTPPPFQYKSTPLQAPSDNSNKDELQKKQTKAKSTIIVTGLIIALISSIYLLKCKEDTANLESQLASAQNEIQIQSENQIKEDNDRKQRLAAATARNMEYRNNWFKYIAVDITNYKYIELGGIEDIQVKVTNNIEFPIDLIIAELTYWKTNGDIYKTEEITITDVEPKNAIIVGGPSSPRGTKLTVEVKKITARKFNFCYDWYSLPGTDGIYGDNRNPNDPWKCGQ